MFMMNTMVHVYLSLFESSVAPHPVQADKCQNGGDRQSCKGAPAHLGRVHGIRIDAQMWHAEFESI